MKEAVTEEVEWAAVALEVVTAACVNVGCVNVDCVGGGDGGCVDYGDGAGGGCAGCEDGARERARTGVLVYGDRRCCRRLTTTKAMTVEAMKEVAQQMALDGPA